MNQTPSSSFSITRQLQLVFAISIALLLISSYASFYSNRKLIETSQWVNHTNEVILNAESLVSTIKDAETGQRGYIITHDASFLAPYNGAYQKTLNIYGYLKKLTGDNELQQQRLSRLKVLVDQRFEQMRRVLTLNDGMSGNLRMRAFVSSHEEMVKGRLLMDDLRKLVDELKKQEQSLLQQRVAEQERYIRYTPILMVVAALVAILLSILAYLRIRADLDERIRRQKIDEEKYRETTKRIAAIEEITARIAGGDYAARSLDEGHDELGRISDALNNMASSLEASFEELKDRNWLQAGVVGIANAIRGERFVKNLSDKLLAAVAGHLEAPVGTLYITDKHMNLHLQGSFAAGDAPREISAGSGLTGQAVKKKELTVTGPFAAEYLRISSSTGSAAPLCIVVLPLQYNGHVTGVVELAMIHQPEELELQFLRDNAEAMAIAINTAVNYERLQDLLEETQAQAEELQSQHNELENINAELEAQTEKLQASDEELRVQQEELQQANQELEERSRLLEEKNLQIMEKNLEVQRKAEELALSTKYKSEFLANMSHELRTPLNSILLLSRLLSENNEQNLSSDQVEFARVIQSSGHGLLALIDEILDLSKIEAGKMQLEYESIPVREIVQDLRSLFEPVARDKKLDFDIVVEEGTPYSLETDKLRLEQVLKNLLSNALKFTSEGGVHMRIASCAGEGRLCIAVIDTGIGIPEEKQKLIFEAFQQADGSTRRKFGGTGLGLSISKELIRLLGGEIHLSSEAGKGSTFTVVVPLSPAYAQPQEQAAFPVVLPAPEEPMAHRPSGKDEFVSDAIPEGIPDDRAAINPGDRSILIVEDDTAFARSLLEYTRKKGYKGIVTVRGDEAAALARQYRPAGILLDLRLPVKSGWEVMEELKSDAKTRPIPVHIMSAHSVRKESLMKGAINFINKPVAFEQMQEIFGKLEHVLSGESGKVLIVEENPKHARALAYFLETFSINSEVKNSIPESVDALVRDVDCVILDMGIPDPKAYDMLEEVKRNPGLEHLPIIIFTGKSLSLSEEQRIKQYADSIVVKTAHSYQRILDEVSLFLHLVDEHQPRETGNDSYRRLGALNDVLKDKTVLIVDDDVRNIFSLTKALEKMNMRVVTAVDGREAMQKLTDHPSVDIVLLDMMMPEMDGYETARRIRQNPDWKRLPVIAVTAKAMTGDREKCIRAGASDYITKPVDVDQLLSLLRVWLYERG